MKISPRDWPKVDMIILLRRRVTASAATCIRTTLEEAAGEDVANVSIVATNDRRAFLSIVAQRVL